MESPNDLFPFKRVLTLGYLIDFWRKVAADEDSPQVGLARDIVARVEKAAELQGPIHDLSVLDKYRDLVALMMSAEFPIARWQDSLAAAILPYSAESIYQTEAFSRLKILERFAQRTSISGVSLDERSMMIGKAMNAYHRILEHFYNVPITHSYPMTYSEADPLDGLDRHYRIEFDTRFAEPITCGALPELTDDQITRLASEPLDLDLWTKTLPPEHFEFHGFVVMSAVDITSQEVQSQLKNDLLQKEALTSPGSIDRLENRLRTLLRLPQMCLGLIALQDEDFDSMADARRIGRSLLFDEDVMPECPTRHRSVYRKAFESSEPIIVSDLEKCDHCTGFEYHLIEQKIASLMVAPLRFEGKLIGLMELASPRSGAIKAFNAVQLMEVIALVATAMKRTLDEQEDRIQAQMKKKYTAIHPSVEWKFRRAAMQELATETDSEQVHEGVVFENVYPLYGLSDIRNSSANRTAVIQEDLIEQLGLALRVIVEAGGERPLPALDEIGFRIAQFVEAAELEATSDIEISALDFLKQDVEPLFDMLASFGPRVRQKINAYRSALDEKLGILYHRRKEYEESVSIINDTISTFLDKQQVVAQSMYPHYFEKYKTDGVDYNAYIGQSLVQRQKFDILYLHNLRLWQLMTTCGIIWQLERVKPSLPVALETAHLILVQNIPLSIRFREDEKRFDVDGAYNVRYEIVKKRIDKAEIRGTQERLTQPGHVAIVYSQSRELAEYKRYFDYLTAAGYFVDDTQEEFLLEDMQGAYGLRALRVKVAPKPPDMETRIQPEWVLDVAQSMAPVGEEV